jgi:hypothetical protein
MKSKAEEQKTAKIIAEMAQRRLLREGPGWNKFKAGVKGAYNAIKDGPQNRANAAEAEKTAGQVANITNAVTNAWATQVKTLQNAGVTPTLKNFADFMQKEAPSLTPPDATAFPTGTDFTNPNTTKNYLKQSIAQHFNNKANGVNTPPAPPAPPPPAPPAKSVWMPHPRDPNLGQIKTPDGRLFIKNSRGWVLVRDPALPGTPIGNIDQITQLETLKAKLDGSDIPTESIKR